MPLKLRDRGPSVRARHSFISIHNATEHNLKGISLSIPRGAITVVTGVSGSGKSSLVFDTILAESQRQFFYTLSHFSRQFLEGSRRPQVTSISGLSPAISLSQIETPPSVRTRVGTLTDLSELVGVLFARFGEKMCPKHKILTEAMSWEEMIAPIQKKNWSTEIIAICAPIVEKKKGHYKAQLKNFAEKGFLKVYIDGNIYSLTSTPELDKEEKHTIKIVIDFIKLSSTSENRLLRAIKQASEEGGGYVECYASSKQNLLLDQKIILSNKHGCPTCGFSWPKLDARYFNPNSLGQCTDCLGLGRQGESEENLNEETEETISEFEKIKRQHIPCKLCQGTGISPQYSSVLLGGKSPQALALMPFSELDSFFSSLAQTVGTHSKNLAFLRLQEEAHSIIKKLCEVGLFYLHSSRSVRSLSGGEYTRLRLAGLLAESLRGVLYILDEPSQGLHPLEMEDLYQNLSRLKNLGNTVIVVDHDEYLMRRADLIIDLGPGGGAKGGNITGVFHPSEAETYKDRSSTAFYLSQGRKHTQKIDGTKTSTELYLTLDQLNLHNLKIDRVRFKLSAFNVVIGLSGAGKSSLVLGTLYPNLLRKIEEAQRKNSKKNKEKPLFCQNIAGFESLKHLSLVDRKPLGRSGQSMPATYLDIFTKIRELYAKLPEAQIYGFTAKDFSLHSSGGRCESCKGRGELTVVIKFLPDARIRCEVCQGKRYRDELLNLKYNNLSLHDVLNLTFDEAFEHFKHHKDILKKIETAKNLGLGYLKLGQSSGSLSGGEAQRLKLIPYLIKKHGPETALILDEPTRGLHFEDVQKLLKILLSLRDKGVTIICIEHNQEFIDDSDWLIELGPKAAAEGGRLLFEGYTSSKPINGI